MTSHEESCQWPPPAQRLQEEPQLAGIPTQLPMSRGCKWKVVGVPQGTQDSAMTETAGNTSHTQENTRSPVALQPANPEKQNNLCFHDGEQLLTYGEGETDYLSLPYM